MKTPSLSSLLLLLLLIFSCSSAKAADDFLECLSENYSSTSNDVYTPANSSFNSILRFSIQNLRFATPSTPKPQVIITPEHESQIPPIVLCAKKTGLEIRTRSGGHDTEGLSYVSRVPFVIIDLINLSEITVDAKAKTAWVGAGATLGSLYYRIAEKSPVLAFPGGACPTVGVGGHFSGGGYGPLLRKYGLAADNVVDARIVDVNGRVLDRKSMGGDMFWAIRGGGAASFGVVVAWKVRLVDVPETVTVFTIVRSSEQNATQLAYRYQHVAPKIDKDLFMGMFLTKGNGNGSRSSFYSVFLGGGDGLVRLMQESFPELGVVREDCIEMSWIESILHFSEAPAIAASQPWALEFLLNRTQSNLGLLKFKSDYVQKPMPESGIRGIFRLLNELEGDVASVYTIPYGGRMAEISKSATPFPHRAGNLFQLSSVVNWPQNEAEDSERYLSWSRRYYSYLTPYVSKSPRGAYYGYKDLDIGVNDVDGDTSYARASIWGKKYLLNNFDRLVRVKTQVDPTNFFKNEQSIPSLRFKKGD